jgi:hypothetical protein
MAYVEIPTRDSDNLNSSADINQLMANITFLKDVATPLTLNVGGVLVAGTGVFKIVNGFKYQYFGSSLTISSISGTTGTADTHATQGTFDVTIGGTSALATPKLFDDTDDVYVAATLSGTPANLLIESGDIIEINFVEGGNATAEDMCIMIYCKVT